jgi:hypothetical protein
VDPGDIGRRHNVVIDQSDLAATEADKLLKYSGPSSAETHYTDSKTGEQSLSFGSERADLSIENLIVDVFVGYSLRMQQPDPLSDDPYSFKRQHQTVVAVQTSCERWSVFCPADNQGGVKGRAASCNRRTPQRVIDSIVSC